MKSDRLSWCLGVTKDNKTNNYMIVLSNKSSGDLGRCIRNNPNKLTWKNKLHILADLAEALTVIHEDNYAHKDLHPGNILLEDDCNGCHLADLGLCGPVIKKEKHAIGVLPYMAPESMDEKKLEFTIKSDIYALGIIMWVLVTDKIPYINVTEHVYRKLLPVSIINGRRPPTVNGIPKEYRDLMEKCWSHDPNSRPNAEEVYRYAKSLLNKMYDEELKLEGLFKPNIETDDEPLDQEVDQEVDRGFENSRLSSSLVYDFGNGN